MRPSLLALSSCLLALLATPALASHTIVPDQHATIQLGVDSGVDTVLVRPGEYAEVVQLSRGVVIIGMVPTVAPFGGDPLPVVGGLVGTQLGGGAVALVGLRFRGIVSLGPTTSSVRVDGCRLDGGISAGNANGSQDHFTNCLSFGDIENNGFNGSVGLCTVVGGTIRIRYSHSTLMVHDNVVVGPAAVGIQLHEDSYASGNYIRGCTIGIMASCAALSEIVGNLIEDCEGVGISSDHCTGSFSQGRIAGNVTRRTGGRGISLNSYWFLEVSSNVIEDAGAEGMFLAGYGGHLRDNLVLRSAGVGIRGGSMIYPVAGNTVLRSGGDGMRFDHANEVALNVAGRSAGHGIAVAGSLSHASMRGNTSFMNAGAGIALGAGDPESAPDSITHNISYGNAVGLAWSGLGTPVLGCNDWFANTGPAVTGTSVGATDVALDPMFCDLPNDIVSLAAGSPLADLAGCGQVGALGVACAVAVGVGDTRPASLGRLRIQPQPSQGAMSFAFDPSDAATTLEVYDVSGARRMSRTLAPRTSGYAWNGTDDAGQALPAGVYFAKLVQSAARSEATVVVIR